MRILCIGAGAIGICLGGSLSAMGADVTFLDRPEMRKDLDEQTLTILNHGVEHKTDRFDIVASYQDLKGQEVDCVLVAVKAFDTDNVIRQLADSGLKFRAILCPQNGVENEEKLRAAFPKADIIGASMVSAVSRLNATTVRVEKNRGIGLCGSSPIIDNIFEMFLKAGLKPKRFENLEAMKWSKMISNLFSNATSGILDLSPFEVYSREGLFRIERAQITEGLDVMKKNGIAVVDLPGLPLKLLVFAIRYLPDSVLRPLLIQSVAKGRGEKMPSFYIEKMKGSDKSEVDNLNGAIVRKGRESGVETPVNSALVRIFNEILKDPKIRADYSRHPELLEKTIL